VMTATHAVSALVLLARSAGARLALDAVPASPLPILPWLLAFPRSADRERTRFELASRFAERVPVVRYGADTAVAPGALADHLLDNLARLGGASR
jgi:hypothetical protein